MFRTILVANRGEIAVRIMRTCREMGIRTIAVYSEADRCGLHVMTADDAVFLGDSEPAASYLNMDKIIAAAREKGAEAIHPGYGFLAENPTFAAKVQSEGLVFIGPPGEVMAKLADKTAARLIMSKGHVPIIPGMTASEADIGRLTEKAEEIGYPVLIKASAGGGGKGMRIVKNSEELADSAQMAASEALCAFGDGSIYLEKYLDRPRHIEFQILADMYGNVVHLFERECSIQRRHQKIIEETPSPALNEDLRCRMGEAATTAAKAAGYVNAGTVEFLLDRLGNFYFLEVNTRLQVEHPITEMTTGLDLVRHQLEIAAGRPLPFSQKRIAHRGHAIECRIYAEDPENGFMPAPGKILFTKLPEGPGVRFDHGIYSGLTVPVNYDPILGKLVVWAEDRPSACSRMMRALQETVILGVKTPVEFLLDIISSEQFRNGKTHTRLIEESFSPWSPDREKNQAALLGYVANDLFGPQGPTEVAVGTGKEGFVSPWHTLGAWDMTC